MEEKCSQTPQHKGKHCKTMSDSQMQWHNPHRCCTLRHAQDKKAMAVSTAMQWQCQW